MVLEGLLVQRLRKGEEEQRLLVVVIHAIEPRLPNGVVDRTAQEHCAMRVVFVSSLHAVQVSKY